jgi:hypothetical protein
VRGLPYATHHPALRAAIYISGKVVFLSGAVALGPLRSWGAHVHTTKVDHDEFRWTVMGEPMPRRRIALLIRLSPTPQPPVVWPDLGRGRCRETSTALLKCLDDAKAERKCLAQLAFFCDAVVRLRLIADGIFEFAIPLGQQHGHHIQTMR